MPARAAAWRPKQRPRAPGGTAAFVFLSPDHTGLARGASPVEGKADQTSMWTPSSMTRSCLILKNRSARAEFRDIQP